MDALDKRMVRACKLGIWDEVQRLVRQERINVGLMDKSNRSAIMWALWGGKCEIHNLTFLVDNGCNLGQTYSKGRTEIMWALMGGNDISILQWLIDNGCKVGERDDEGRTEIMWAIECKRDILVLEWLKRNGCEVAQTDYRGKSTLDYAYEIGCGKAVLKWLRMNGCEESDSGGLLKRLGLVGYETSHYDESAKLLRIKEFDDSCSGGLTTLMMVLKNKCDAKVLQELIDSGYQLGQRDAAGRTEIMWAIMGRNETSVLSWLTENGSPLFERDKSGKNEIDYVFKHGCDINVLRWLRKNDPNGRSEIMMALQSKCNVAVLERLKKNGCKLGQYDTKGMCELSVALKHFSNDDILKWLLEKNCSIESKSVLKERNWIMWALQTHCSIHTLERLKNIGCNLGQFDSDGRCELSIALGALCTDRVLMWLLENRCSMLAHVVKERNWILWALAHRCNADALNWLSVNGCAVGQVDDLGRNELELAAKYKDEERVLVLDWLKKAGCILDDRMANACRNGNITDLMRLIEEGVQVCGVQNKSWGKTAITLLLESGKCNVDILELIVKHGGLLHNGKGDNLVNTALHDELSKDIIQWLAGQGCKMNQRDQAKNSSVMIALTKGYDHELVKCLKLHGCPIDQTNDNRKSEIMLALEKEYPLETLDWLVQNGCNLGKRDHNMTTEVMIALHNHKPISILKWLVENGCNLGARDKHRRTEIMYALQNNYDINALDWLKENGAQIGCLDSSGVSETLVAYQSKCHISTFRWLLENDPGLKKHIDQCNLDIDVQLQVDGDKLPRTLAGICTLDPKVARACSNCNWSDVLDLMEEKKMMITGRAHGGRWPAYTAVMIALTNDNCDKDFLQFLIENGCHLGQKDLGGRTEIMIAVEFGHDISTIDFLHRQGCPLGQQDSEGKTELMIACLVDAMESVMDFLVKTCGKSYVNETDHEGFTALMLTAQCYDQDANESEHSSKPLLWFVSQAQKQESIITKNDIDFQNSLGVTALMVAVYNENEENIKSLCQICDLNLQIVTGETALHLCISQNDQDHHLYQRQISRTKKMSVAQYPEIIKKDVTKEKKSNSLLLMHTILSCGGDSNISDNRGRSPFLEACAEGLLEVAKLLYANGSKLDHCDMSGLCPVMAATQGGHVNVLRWLVIETKANVARKDNEGRTALHMAMSQDCNGVIIDMLLESSKGLPSVSDDNGNTALHVGVQKLKVDNVNVFLSKGVQHDIIDMKNSNGKTALHDLYVHAFVHEEGRRDKLVKDITTCLIEHGAMVDSRDNCYNTPIFEVLKANRVDIAEILVKSGALVCATNYLGQNILHAICQIKGYDTSRKVPSTLAWILSQQGMNINSIDHFKLTPLHWACISGFNDIPLLIKLGADVWAKDRNQLVPLTFATKSSSTFRTILQEMQHQNKAFAIETEFDLQMMLRFSQFYHTLDEIKEILINTDIDLPCPLSQFTHSDWPTLVKDNEEEYVNVDDWIREHRRKHASQLGVFAHILARYTRDILSAKLTKNVLLFMTAVLQKMKEQHPALPSDCYLSGSVHEGTKVLQADEFDFLVACDIHNGFEVEGCAASPYVKLKRKQAKRGESIKCPVCEALLDVSIHDNLSRNFLLEHFYGVFADDTDDRDLWEDHPNIYRLSASDITAANRNISCLVVAIHDDKYPFLKATIDIVPMFFIETPSWVKIPDFQQKRTCGVVAKWASDQPLDADIFRLSFSLCETEMFHIMPSFLRQAYQLAKVVKDDYFFPVIKNQGLKPSDFISSYLLKTVTFSLFMALRDTVSEVLVQCWDENISGTDLIYLVVAWTRAIYSVLSVAVECRCLMHTYIPGFNLIGADERFINYQHIILSYTKALVDILSIDDKCSDLTRDAVQCSEIVVGLCTKKIRDDYKTVTAFE